jgi:hypothetical protein
MHPISGGPRQVKAEHNSRRRVIHLLWSKTFRGLPPKMCYLGLLALQGYVSHMNGPHKSVV